MKKKDRTIQVQLKMEKKSTKYLRTLSFVHFDD